MGAVFRARHRALGHIVAVKVLPPEVAASAIRRERFRREATLGASLEHPNIVRVYDFDTKDGITFLIMTFVRGVTLEERLRSAARPATDAILRTLREIADALAYAHRRGIVHRDVKPSNILLDEDSGRALLADFGIAHVEGAAETSLTQPGTLVGTPGYMAPEQLAGGRVDGRADLYSLAAVTFESLTGEPPDFKADRTALARALRAARPELSARAAAVLVAPLAEQPDERPSSADAWMASLENTRARRWRWAVAALVVVAAAGVAWALLGRAPPSSTPPRLAVMPFAILGTPPPYAATQLPEYFVSRFRPVEGIEVVSFGRVVAQTGTAPPSNEEARELARRLGARFFIQGSVSYSGPTVTLTATLYQGDRARGSGKATGRMGADESDVMDHVWAQLYSEFTPSPDVTLPNGGPDALAAYLNAEAAFRRGDYQAARDQYTRVIRADTGFAIGRLRLALVAAQVDATEQGFGAALRGAVLHQHGLSTADSLLLDGFAVLLSRGDGVTALERFKRATESAPGYPPAWYVLGEYYYHFGGLFDQSVGEARVYFDRVLDLDPRFSPAISHLISLNQAVDRAETRRLIRRYLRIDSTSVVAEAVGIADTLILGSAADRLALLNHVCRHSFGALQYLAFGAAAFGTKAQREGPARRVLRCLEQRGATDQERVRALRMNLAADLAAGWVDSARHRLDGATGAWVERERDLWVVVAHDAQLPALGDWDRAARRLSARAGAVLDTDVTAHWALARAGVERSRHAAALARLAADGAPLPASLAADLQAHAALARGDSGAALQLWAGATQHYAVLSVPLDLVASLWPLRLDMVRVAVARRDSAFVARGCASFDPLIGYTDQVAQPEVERLCRVISSH